MFLLAAGCAANPERATGVAQSSPAVSSTPSQPEVNAESEARLDASASLAADAGSAPAPDASAPPSDAGSDAATDARAPSAPQKPLVLKGVRKCTTEENQDQVCYEGTRTGMCLDDYCVTFDVCPRYCAASVKRDFEDCKLDVKECQGIPECVKALRQTQTECENLGKRMTQDCVSTVCPNIRALPPKPPAN